MRNSWIRTEMEILEHKNNLYLLKQQKCKSNAQMNYERIREMEKKETELLERLRTTQ